MSEEIREPEEETEGGFQRISSGDTWRSNGNGIAHARRSASDSRFDVAPDCETVQRFALGVGVVAGGTMTVVPCGCEGSRSDGRSRLRTYSQLGHLERMTFESLLPEGRRGRVDEGFVQVGY